MDEVKNIIRQGEKSIKKLKCDCYNPFQDKRYGAQMRIHNKTIKGWRCTVCGKDKN